LLLLLLLPLLLLLLLLMLPLLFPLLLLLLLKSDAALAVGAGCLAINCHLILTFCFSSCEPLMVFLRLHPLVDLLLLLL
jgi:hypothetical protein